MITIQSTASNSAVARAEAVLNPSGYRIAMQAALSRTVTTGRVRTARRIGDVLALKISTIRAQIRVTRPSLQDLTASVITGRAEMFALRDFPNAKLKPGVRVKVWRDRPAEVLAGTFRAGMKNGHAGIFERARLIEFANLSEEDQRSYRAGLLHFSKSRRVRRGLRGNRVARLPIKERYGPDATTALLGGRQHAGIVDDVAEELGDVLEKNVDSQIERVMARKNLTRLEGIIDRA